MFLPAWSPDPPPVLTFAQKPTASACNIASRCPSRWCHLSSGAIEHRSLAAEPAAPAPGYAHAPCRSAMAIRSRIRWAQQSWRWLVVVGGVAIAHHHAGKASPFSGLDQLHGKPHLLACGGKDPVHGGERTSQALASGPSCIGCALVKWNSSCRSKASAGACRFEHDPGNGRCRWRQGSSPKGH